MSTIRRAAILKLASAAYEMELEVMIGRLERGEDGRWLVGGQELARILGAMEGQELVVIVGSLADNRPLQTQTCRTCGRDYADIECPYCRSNRIRLRGRA
jgi:hypothetical protein